MNVSFKALLEGVLEEEAVYRLVVGEKGNEKGHIIPLKVDSDEAAKKALKKEMKKYGKDGWGRVEYMDREEELHSFVTIFKA